MRMLTERLSLVRERIMAAARQAGRDPGEVGLIAVTKTHPVEVIRAALDAGLKDFGENRIQEAEAKIAALADKRADSTWHLIGHLQSNKARKAAALFDLVHSVDRLRLAEALDRHVAEIRGQARNGIDPVRSPNQLPYLAVLLQVNVSGEASKEGFALAGWEQNRAALETFRMDLERILALPHLRVQGLMTIAPLSDRSEDALATFRATRRLRDQLARWYPQADWRHLSMGMTDDFEAAIAEGATLVRIGRALFGQRT